MTAALRPVRAALAEQWAAFPRRLRPTCTCFHAPRRSLKTSPIARQAAPTSNDWLARKDLTYDPRPALDSKGKIPAMPYDTATLPASAPEYKAHIIIHPYSRARQSASWPSHLESVSPLMSEISSRCKTGASLEGYGVSFSEGLLDDAPSDSAAAEWDPKTPKFMRPVPGGEAEDEEYLLHVYLPPGKWAKVGPLSMRTLDEGKPLAEKILDALATAPMQTAKRKATDESHIYVCMHGSRDCRCGVVGTELLDALRDTFSKENEQSGRQLKPTRVYGVSHIGGHKWAASALVYPHGDWYGNLRPWDAPLLLRASQAPGSSGHDLQDDREKMVHWSRWRGRLGMSQEKMMQHYEHWGPPLTQAATITPRARTGPASSSSAAGTVQPAAAPAPAPAATSEVPLRFRSYEGEWFEVSGRLGETLKDTAKRHNLPSIEATCGGAAECCTCHAYFAEAGEEAQGLGQVDGAPPEEIIGGPKEEEDDMLDYAVSRKATSRLTCQVKVTKELSEWMQKGGRIELPRF